MVGRTVLEFGLRCADGTSLDAASPGIAAALGTPLEFDEYHQFPAFVGSVFGMTIALFEWGGPRGTTLLALEGSVEDAAFVMFPDGSVRQADSVDISDAVADLLAVRGAGQWHRPTEAELAAHTAYSRAGEP